MKRLLLVGLVLAACSSGGTCPELRLTGLIASGEYEADSGGAESRYCAKDCDVVFPPHDGVHDLKLEVDLDGESVEIIYMRDGKRVVERWRIESHEPS